MAFTLQVVIDCHDPAALAPFWAQLLGYQLQEPPAGFASWPEFLTAQGIPEDEWNAASAVVDPAGRGPRIFFQRVPEPKTVKNRVHIDVTVSGGRAVAPDERRARIEAAVERATALGASRLRAHEQHGEFWVVMQDPEGNEFCLQ